MINPPTSADVTTVLVVLPWSPALPGGVSVVVRNLLAQWNHGGIAARAVVSEWTASRPGVDSEGNTKFRFALLGALTWWGLAKSLFIAPLRLWRTWQLLQRQRICAVNFHYPSLDALGVALLRRIGLFRGQLVLSFHGTDVRAPLTPLEARLWRWLFHMATDVTACSKALAHEIALAYSVNDESVAVIYNGVDAELFQPMMKLHPTIGEAVVDPYIVSVGSYIPRKGHRLLLDAFAKVVPSFPSLRLVIVGMDGPERTVLMAQVMALGLQNVVMLLVNLKPADVADVLAGAALCVQPSNAEPFGLAVIEAGACNVPVLASAVGGHMELITDQKNGCLFAPGDVAQCAEKLNQMLADNDASRKMAERFRSEIQVKYTWQVCAKAYLQKLGV